MKKILLAMVLSLFCGITQAAELVYEGTWLTTNRKLDGDMTCIVTDKGKNRWEGRFYGIWQGVKFDYTVDWTGTPYSQKSNVDRHVDWPG